ncbi:hypothetical protein F5Y18DRAFT_435933 [Xylariaceae sp. FL1019]|nr:hypothetical protein F5Y18DRAFT_435933 [Xylariaceae sp. FL1019]
MAIIKRYKHPTTSTKVTKSTRPKELRRYSLWESLMDSDERALRKYCAVSNTNINELNIFRAVNTPTEIPASPVSESEDSDEMWAAYGVPRLPAPYFPLGDICNVTPSYVRSIPDILRRPRPPPYLPPSILSLSFGAVLCNFDEFLKLVARYEQCHGRSVFNFWTQEEISLVETHQASPALTNSYWLCPSIPPRVLDCSFADVLYATPLLSNLIDRYHRDHGLEFFGFWGPNIVDPRPRVPEDEPPQHYERNSDVEPYDAW